MTAAGLRQPVLVPTCHVLIALGWLHASVLPCLTQTIKTNTHGTPRPPPEPYFNETGSNCPSVLPRKQQKELLELAVKSVQVCVCVCVF